MAVHGAAAPAHQYASRFLRAARPIARPGAGEDARAARGPVAPRAQRLFVMLRGLPGLFSSFFKPVNLHGELIRDAIVPDLPKRVVRFFASEMRGVKRQLATRSLPSSSTHPASPYGKCPGETSAHTNGTKRIKPHATARTSLRRTGGAIHATARLRARARRRRGGAAGPAAKQPRTRAADGPGLRLMSARVPSVGRAAGDHIDLPALTQDTGRPGPVWRGPALHDTHTHPR